VRRIWLVLALGARSLFVLVQTPLAAQNPAVLTGRVSSVFGAPLSGASVVIDTMSVSATANAEGRYSITIPPSRVAGQSAVLRARAIGFAPETRTIIVTAGSQTHDFVLRRDVNRLEEVVVTGTVAATSQKKLAYSLTRLDDMDMPVPTVNALLQLQGKVPGARVMQPSGRPGAAPAILLRGPKSLAGGGRQQGPLIIVDGTILNVGAQDINPGDVENVEVIMGAAASSLYGSRAGAGVIQITTKSGRRGPPGTRFTLRSEYGLTDVQNEYAYATRHILLMDEHNERFCIKVAGLPTCSRTVDFEAERRRINNVPTSDALPPYAFERDYGIGGVSSVAELKGLFQVNQWPTTYNPIAQIVTGRALRNNTVDVTSRSGTAAYFASLSDLAEQGAIRYLGGYRRNTARVNVDESVGDEWSISLRSAFARGTQFPATSVDAGSGSTENFFRLTRVPPSVDLLRRDDMGRLYIRSNPLAQGGQNANPLYAFENTRGQLDDDRFLASIAVRHTPLAWLSLEGTASADRRRTEEFDYRDRDYRTTAAFGQFFGGTHGSAFEESTADLSQNVMLSARAESEFLGRWRGALTARYSYEQQERQSSSGYGEQLAVTGVETLKNATLNTELLSAASSVRAIGAIAGGRLEYSERYIVDGLVRYDGSSLFGAEERWHPYYRASLAWRVSDEPFWPLRRVVDDGKLRASVGTAGGRPRFEAQYEAFAVGSGGQVSPTATLGNRYLKPEHTIETEYGFDAEVLHRYGLSVTYARDITTDQILRIPAPAASGYSSQWENAGTLNGKTWEVMLRVPIVTKRDFVWTSQLGWDRNRTYITGLNRPPFFVDVTNTATGGTNGIRFFYGPGERYGTLYGRRYARACSELPPPFDTQCGPGQEWQTNDEGYVVWVGQGHTWQEGITSNLWQATRPGCVKNGVGLAAAGPDECSRRGGVVNAPWGAPNTHWGMPTILRDSTAAPLVAPLGNTLPDYRVTMSHNVRWHRASVYGLLDLSVGNRVYNMERHWSLGDFMAREEDQNGKTPETAKPIGYYWRASEPLSSLGTGGFYGDLLGSNRTTEDGSYTKLRELSIGYELAAAWSVSLIGRNLYTWTRYSGWDPEVGSDTGMPSSAAIATGGMYQYPPTRTFTLALTARF
jgi:TonB-linked SusC/RagA family outer membrane protein